MVLHVLSDDKFTDYAIKQFQAEEMQSEMVVIPSGACHSFKRCDKLKIISYPSPQFTELLTNLGSYSGIVLHGLFWPYCEDIINATPNNTKIAWYFWGGELYSRPDVEYSFLAPITRLLYNIHRRKNNKRVATQHIWQLPLELYKRIDFCLTGEQEEYEFAKAYTHSSMQFLWYTCYSLEDTIGELITYRSSGKNILFCNSAALETNIFDASIWLQKPSYRKHMKGRSLIVPLSYGSPWIKNLMLKIGPLLFKDFIPLIDFLPRNEYNKIMLDCSTLILPYYSPAGQGNIITALWLGMRVYLSEKSIAFNFFKRIGVEIYSLERDFAKYGCESMLEEHVQKNKKVLVEMFSANHVYGSAKRLIDILEGNNEQ